MYKVTFIHSKSFEIGLHGYHKVLREEIKPYLFSKKIYWFPSRYSTSNLFKQPYFPQLLQDLKNDAYFIFDITAEPGKTSWVDNLLNPLIDVLKQNNISLKRLIVLSATPKHLYGVCDYGYLFFNDQLYNFTYRYKGSKLIAPQKDFKKHFLSLSRKDTLDRRYLNFLLHTKSLFDKGIVSHGRGGNTLDPDRSDLEIARSDLNFVETHNINIKDYLKYGFKKHFLDTTNMSNYRWYHTVYMYNYDFHLNISKNVPLDLVNETNAFGIDSLYITEKIIKPIISRNLFLVIANPFVLAFMKQIGFKTFPHLFDESYDEEIDNVKRTNMVIKNLQDFCNIPLTDCKKIYDDNAELLDYNYNHLLKTKWDFSLGKKIEKYIMKESSK